jgi:hypothetical protein
MNNIFTISMKVNPPKTEIRFKGQTINPCRMSPMETDVRWIAKTLTTIKKSNHKVP